VLVRVYFVGWAATFLWLTIEDALAGWRAFAAGLAFNPLIAMAWPAYWLLLRRIM